MMFFQRLVTSGRHNSALSIDRWKFITKWSLYEMSSFHVYRWESIQTHSHGPYTPYKKHPQIFCDVGRGWTARQITLTTVSCRQPVTIDYLVTWH